jgi:methylenetetrahydrofolate dehydrogenase (NADP+)/methenyltetrahydrofolate cyclohydrolase
MNLSSMNEREHHAARMLDGVVTASQVRFEIGPQVSAFRKRTGRPPGLGIVLVGDNPASEVYVRNKLRSADQIGLKADLERLPSQTSLSQLLEAIERLNRSEAHHGILVQFPLPKGLGPEAERRVCDAVSPYKDVDGFHPLNVGRLAQNRAELVPCTPAGIIELLDRNNIEVAGRHAVVIGRSDIVGKPVALLLLHRHATVTVCHSRTPDLAQIARTADVLVAALGRPGFVTKEMVKPGAVVIDVGINRLDRSEDVGSLYGFQSER